MKTTVDLPENLLHQAKIVAAQKRTTLKNLIINGLDMAIRSETTASASQEALIRLQKGLHLGGKPLTRIQVYERHPIS